jgi:hypothetical protein
MGKEAIQYPQKPFQGFLDHRISTSLPVSRTPLSAFAFTTCEIRPVGTLWEAGPHPSPLSAGGGTSRIVSFDQRSPTRTLGAFVPSNSPFFQTVPGHTNLLLMFTHTNISDLRTVLAPSIAGAVGRSESTLANGGELSKVRDVFIWLSSLSSSCLRTP